MKKSEFIYSKKKWIFNLETPQRGGCIGVGNCFWKKVMSISRFGARDASFLSPAVGVLGSPDFGGSALALGVIPFPGFVALPDLGGEPLSDISTLLNILDSMDISSEFEHFAAQTITPVSQQLGRFGFDEELRQFSAEVDSVMQIILEYNDAEPNIGIMEAWVNRIAQGLFDLGYVDQSARLVSEVTEFMGLAQTGPDLAKRLNKYVLVRLKDLVGLQLQPVLLKYQGLVREKISLEVEQTFSSLVCEFDRVGLDKSIIRAELDRVVLLDAEEDFSDFVFYCTTQLELFSNLHKARILLERVDELLTYSVLLGLGTDQQVDLPTYKLVRASKDEQFCTSLNPTSLDYLLALRGKDHCILHAPDDRFVLTQLRGLEFQFLQQERECLETERGQLARLESLYPMFTEATAVSSDAIAFLMGHESEPSSFEGFVETVLPSILPGMCAEMPQEQVRDRCASFKVCKFDSFEELAGAVPDIILWFKNPLSMNLMIELPQSNQAICFIKWGSNCKVVHIDLNSIDAKSADISPIRVLNIDVVGESAEVGTSQFFSELWPSDFTEEPMVPFSPLFSPVPRGASRARLSWSPARKTPPMRRVASTRHSLGGDLTSLACGTPASLTRPVHRLSAYSKPVDRKLVSALADPSVATRWLVGEAAFGEVLAAYSEPGARQVNIFNRSEFFRIIDSPLLTKFLGQVFLEDSKKSGRVDNAKLRVECLTRAGDVSSTYRQHAFNLLFNAAINLVLQNTSDEVLGRCQTVERRVSLSTKRERRYQQEAVGRAVSSRRGVESALKTLAAGNIAGFVGVLEAAVGASFVPLSSSSVPNAKYPGRAFYFHALGLVANDKETSSLLVMRAHVGLLLNILKQNQGNPVLDRSVEEFVSYCRTCYKDVADVQFLCEKILAINAHAEGGSVKPDVFLLASPLSLELEEKLGLDFSERAEELVGRERVTYAELEVVEEELASSGADQYVLSLKALDPRAENWRDNLVLFFQKRQELRLEEAGEAGLLVSMLEEVQSTCLTPESGGRIVNDPLFIQAIDRYVFSSIRDNQALLLGSADLQRALQLFLCTLVDCLSSSLLPVIQCYSVLHICAEQGLVGPIQRFAHRFEDMLSLDDGRLVFAGVNLETVFESDLYLKVFGEDPILPQIIEGNLVIRKRFPLHDGMVYQLQIESTGQVSIKSGVLVGDEYTEKFQLVSLDGLPAQLARYTVWKSVDGSSEVGYLLREGADNFGEIVRTSDGLVVRDIRSTKNAQLVMPVVDQTSPLFGLVSNPDISCSLWVEMNRRAATGLWRNFRLVLHDLQLNQAGTEDPEPLEIQGYGSDFSCVLGQDRYQLDYELQVRVQEYVPFKQTEYIAFSNSDTGRQMVLVFVGSVPILFEIDHDFDLIPQSNQTEGYLLLVRAFLSQDQTKVGFSPDRVRGYLDKVVKLGYTSTERRYLQGIDLDKLDIEADMSGNNLVVWLTVAWMQHEAKCAVRPRLSDIRRCLLQYRFQPHSIDLHRMVSSSLQFRTGLRDFYRATEGLLPQEMVLRREAGLCVELDTIGFGAVFSGFRKQRLDFRSVNIGATRDLSQVFQQLLQIPDSESFDRELLSRTPSMLKIVISLLNNRGLDIADFRLIQKMCLLCSSRQNISTLGLALLKMINFVASIRQEQLGLEDLRINLDLEQARKSGSIAEIKQAKSRTVKEIVLLRREIVATRDENQELEAGVQTLLVDKQRRTSSLRKLKASLDAMPGKIEAKHLELSRALDACASDADRIAADLRRQEELAALIADKRAQIDAVALEIGAVTAGIAGLRENLDRHNKRHSHILQESADLDRAILRTERHIASERKKLNRARNKKPILATIKTLNEQIADYQVKIRRANDYIHICSEEILHINGQIALADQRRLEQTAALDTEKGALGALELQLTDLQRSALVQDRVRVDLEREIAALEDEQRGLGDAIEEKTKELEAAKTVHKQQAEELERRFVGLRALEDQIKQLERDKKIAESTEAALMKEVSTIVRGIEQVKRYERGLGVFVTRLSKLTVASSSCSLSELISVDLGGGKRVSLVEFLSDQMKMRGRMNSLRVLVKKRALTASLVKGKVVVAEAQADAFDFGTVPSFVREQLTVLQGLVKSDDRLLIEGSFSSHPLVQVFLGELESVAPGRAAQLRSEFAGYQYKASRYQFQAVAGVAPLPAVKYAQAVMHDYVAVLESRILASMGKTDRRFLAQVLLDFSNSRLSAGIDSNAVVNILVFSNIAKRLEMAVCNMERALVADREPEYLEAHVAKAAETLATLDPTRMQRVGHDLFAQIAIFQRIYRIQLRPEQIEMMIDYALGSKQIFNAGTGFGKTLLLLVKIRHRLAQNAQKPVKARELVCVQPTENLSLEMEAHFQQFYYRADIDLKVVSLRFSNWTEDMWTTEKLLECQKNLDSMRKDSSGVLIISGRDEQVFIARYQRVMATGSDSERSIFSAIMTLFQNHMRKYLDEFDQLIDPCQVTCTFSGYRRIEHMELDAVDHMLSFLNGFREEESVMAYQTCRTDGSSYQELKQGFVAVLVRKVREDAGGDDSGLFAVLKTVPEPQIIMLTDVLTGAPPSILEPYLNREQLLYISSLRELIDRFPRLLALEPGKDYFQPDIDAVVIPKDGSAYSALDRLFLTARQMFGRDGGREAFFEVGRHDIEPLDLEYGASPSSLVRTRDFAYSATTGNALNPLLLSEFDQSRIYTHLDSTASRGLARMVCASIERPYEACDGRTFLEEMLRRRDGRPYPMYVDAGGYMEDLPSRDVASVELERLLRLVDPTEREFVRVSFFDGGKKRVLDERSLRLSGSRPFDSMQDNEPDCVDRTFYMLSRDMADRGTDVKLTERHEACITGVGCLDQKIQGDGRVRDLEKRKDTALTYAVKKGDIGFSEETCLEERQTVFLEQLSAREFEPVVFRCVDNSLGHATPGSIHRMFESLSSQPGAPEGLRLVFFDELGTKFVMDNAGIHAFVEGVDDVAEFAGLTVFYLTQAEIVPDFPDLKECAVETISEEDVCKRLLLRRVAREERLKSAQVMQTSTDYLFWQVQRLLPGISLEMPDLIAIRAGFTTITGDQEKRLMTDLFRNSRTASREIRDLLSIGIQETSAIVKYLTVFWHDLILLNLDVIREYIDKGPGLTDRKDLRALISLVNNIVEHSSSCAVESDFWPYVQVLNLVQVPEAVPDLHRSFNRQIQVFGSGVKPRGLDPKLATLASILAPLSSLLRGTGTVFFQANFCQPVSERDSSSRVAARVPKPILYSYNRDTGAIVVFNVGDVRLAQTLIRRMRSANVELYYGPRCVSSPSASAAGAELCAEQIVILILRAAHNDHLAIAKLSASPNAATFLSMVKAIQDRVLL
jgi:hypothetical protein